MCTPATAVDCYFLVRFCFAVERKLPGRRNHKNLMV